MNPTSRTEFGLRIGTCPGEEEKNSYTLLKTDLVLHHARSGKVWQILVRLKFSKMKHCLMIVKTRNNY